MNKTDRLLAIVLELQRKEMLRAEDLAGKFEISVRTIYRDIQALSEAGVPIMGAPGLGYSLMAGYFLPPVSFTVEEAVTLLIGTDFVEQKFDRGYGAKAQSAQGKIEAILPETVRKEASRARKSVKLVTTYEADNSEEEKQNIEILRQAVLEERKVKFGYKKQILQADGNRNSVRTASPYGMALIHGTWMLIAYCHLRQELRHFRLSRISELSLLEERFDRPVDFNLQQYIPLDDRNLPVRLLADSSIADKVKDANNYYMEAIENHPDGLLVTLRVRQPEELLQWVLGWGSNIVVLDPQSLRQMVYEEAEKMLKRY
jgi:predicted DNA-binding transcriptional regulator YafY